MSQVLSAVAAGHLCLDIFPNLDHLPRGEFATIFQPGRLVQTGAIHFATGGLVSNTGLALHRLGVPTRLVAKIGADPFGQIVRDLIASRAPQLVAGLTQAPDAATSYSIIISPPGVDRLFLHCPGANDAFTAADVPYDLVAQAGLFHFGYPPVMRRMYANGGAELAEVLRRAKATGVTTSLDLTFPDPSSDSGRADWRAILSAALPHVDVFLPSVEELLFMLRREQHEKLNEHGEVVAQITPELLTALGAELLGLGAKVAVIKIGHRGLYLRTARAGKLEQMGRARPENCDDWAGRELWAPCFRANVVGATGAGDATIAGFLSAFLRGLSPYEALTAAVAVGACNVEAADALSGLRSWEDTLARVAAGWERHALELDSPGWRWNAPHSLWEKNL